MYPDKFTRVNSDGVKSQVRRGEIRIGDVVMREAKMMRVIVQPVAFGYLFRRRLSARGMYDGRWYDFCVRLGMAIFTLVKGNCPFGKEDGRDVKDLHPRVDEEFQVVKFEEVALVKGEFVAVEEVAK